MASYTSSSVFKVLVISSHPERIDAFLSPAGLLGRLMMETDERREIDALPSRPIRFNTEVAPESKVGVQKLENALIMGHPFSVAIVSQTLQGTENGAETISQLWEYQPDLQIIFCVPKDADPDEISARFEFPQQMLVLEEPVTSIEIRQAARMLSLKWDQFSEFCYRLQELNRVLDQRALKLQATNRRLEREVTERRVAESRFASAFRLSTVAMAILSVDNGRVLDANESLFELLDTTSQALLGQTLKKFQSLDDAVSWAVARSLLPRSSKVASIECRFQRTPTEIRDLLISAEVIDCTDESSLLLTLTNFTKLKQLEDSIRVTNRSEAVVQLTLGITHRFNNLLTVINGQASLLGEGGLTHPTAAHSVSQIIAASKEATSLSRRLATLTNPLPTFPKSLCVNLRIQQFGILLRPSLDAQIELAMDLTPNLPSVLIDEAALEQVLLNLSTKAVTAMPQGGRLTLATHEVGLDAQSAQRRHKRARTGRFVSIQVTDTGAGMDDRTLQKILDPFFSIASQGKEVNYELAAAEACIQDLGGWIEVESIVGEGNQFRILLPAITEVPSATQLFQPPPSQARMNEAPNAASILLVEDDLAVRFFIRVLLEQLGHRVYEASNANEALQVWNSIGSSINLLLTDAIMPGSKTGRQLAEELRHQRPNLGVILMSGYQSGRFDAVGEPEFIGTFLHKPCSIDDLKEAIKQQLDVADSSAIAL